MTVPNYMVIEQYRGCGIANVNKRSQFSFYYGVVINGQLSCIALISIKACKNVIDVYLKYNGQAPDTL